VRGRWLDYDFKRQRILKKFRGRKSGQTVHGDYVPAYSSMHCMARPSGFDIETPLTFWPSQTMIGIAAAKSHEKIDIPTV